ncbi:IS110 family transposase [Niveispirillum cyanobacteriorum]|uniref:Transposase IS116/IS110/IS902 C-terminal domain-containing protein n=2 Tax=Niveispirillum TaxID=1543704 RepID=A0A255Z690_9PROT|nr:IS110 family transposase [Niveispirillum cyanobacteriorum]OYQ37057.1 hypothetical protein CHU95_02470 [Niveispirillum lacus]GGE87855.1 hypothetical protein GCM10011317_51060 [Niveispirillum cyanobacteriorum]
MAAGFEMVLLETRLVKAALSAMTVKTDQTDARGIARMVRMGWYRPVHCKTASAQEVRALLVARKLLVTKLLDLESCIGSILGGGLKTGAVTKPRFEARVRELIAGHHPMLGQVMTPMLAARGAMRTELTKLHQHLMTVPGVGPFVALTFRSAVDNPAGLANSKAVGAHFGLTPTKYQSGETDVTERISKVGDDMVSTAFFEASSAMLRQNMRFSSLKRRAMEIAKRRGAEASEGGASQKARHRPASQVG